MKTAIEILLVLVSGAILLEFLDYANAVREGIDPMVPAFVYMLIRLTIAISCLVFYCLLVFNGGL